MTIPAPSTMHFRQGRQNISKQAYPDMDVFFDDLAKTYQKAIRAFYDAGCRYLQLDDTAWSMMCDPKEREHSRERGDNPGRAARDIRASDQQGAGGQAGRHDHHHAFLPRQFPLHLHCQRRLRLRRGAIARQRQHRRLFPRIRHRPLRRLRAAALRAEGQQAGRARSRHLEERRSWRRRTPSSGGSTRRPNMSRWISFACRRNAASPRPRKATFLPRTSNGRSCG